MLSDVKWMRAEMKQKAFPAMRASLVIDEIIHTRQQRCCGVDIRRDIFEFKLSETFLLIISFQMRNPALHMYYKRRKTLLVIPYPAGPNLPVSSLSYFAQK